MVSELGPILKSRSANGAEAASKRSAATKLNLTSIEIGAPSLHLPES
jgi:hypothetical protein